MESNTYSSRSPDGLSALAAAVEQLAAQDRAGLADHVRAERVLVLRRLLDRLEGRWLNELAGLDAHGAAGAEEGVPAGSTASWLGQRLHMGASAARALFGGPLTATAQALTTGQLSAAPTRVLAAGTHHLPGQVTAEAEPVLVEAARHLDPPRLRRVISHLRLVADPDGAAGQAERRHQDRWLRRSPSWEGMVALDGLLEPEAGQTLLAAWNPEPAPQRRRCPLWRPTPGRRPG